MAELHSNVYYKHDDPDVMKQLNTLFYECNGDKEKIISIAKTLNPSDGEDQAFELIESVDEPKYDLDAESLEQIGGYSVCHFVHGSIGDEIVENMVKFLHELVPGTHAQAWGCGDDDPWEYWIKFEDGKIIRKDDEPYEDEEEDEAIMNTIYAWWHSTMPDSIKEGFLNEEDEDEEY